jgi:hypothetical protein
MKQIIIALLALTTVSQALDGVRWDAGGKTYRYVKGLRTSDVSGVDVMAYATHKQLKRKLNPAFIRRSDQQEMTTTEKAARISANKRWDSVTLLWVAKSPVEVELEYLERQSLKPETLKHAETSLWDLIRKTEEKTTLTLIGVGVRRFGGTNTIQGIVGVLDYAETIDPDNNTLEKYRSKLVGKLVGWQIMGMSMDDAYHHEVD